ncbi:MAG: thiamine-phosphate kinase [Deltaproteobacteria bacterium]|nr:thiamine-phosphate kinase [Deltaproteobacteria bacterium]MCB9785546.1 thiamine-phosphate kinase [Deltaproteobacteria bacterium]
MTAGDAGEAALIEAMSVRVPRAPSPCGPGDDAALLPAGPARCVTTDALMEGVHFLRAHPAAWLGWKALAVNLSDVAAMGARPEGFVVAAALPEDLPLRYWEGMAEGMGALAREAGCLLCGGDIVRSPGPMSLAITAWGSLPGVRALRRDGGRVGDRVMVAGTPGRAGAGLAEWLERAAEDTAWRLEPLDDVSPCLREHLRPTPPLAAGPFALEAGAHAAMDLSDGLSTDLPRLARASGLTLVIDLDALPEDPALPGATVDARVAGGEDFGLVALVRPEDVSRFAAEGFVELGGAEAAGAEPVIYLRGGRPTRLSARAFTHFAID